MHKLLEQKGLYNLKNMHNENLTEHQFNVWKGSKDELKVGIPVAVNYCPHPEGGRVYSRHEYVVQINEDCFITEVSAREFYPYPVGYHLDVFPYTEENQARVAESNLSLLLSQELGNTSLNQNNYLPKDYGEVLHHIRALQELEARRSLDDENIIRERRKMLWDIAVEFATENSFRFNNPYNDDWKMHPEDTDFRDGRLTTFISGTSRLDTKCSPSYEEA